MAVSVSGITADDIKTSLRIDITDDDSMIADYISNAESYVQNAVNPDVDLSRYDQFKFAVSLLVQFWYQNRATDMTKTPYQVVSMIQQLRGLVNTDN